MGEEKLTMRDQFAIAALEGLVASVGFNQIAEDMMKKAGIKPNDFDDFIAMMAYDFADAMLKRRQMKPKPR